MNEQAARLRKKNERMLRRLSEPIPAEEGPFTVKYWENFKRSELRFSKQIGEDSTAVVNGIPISREDFPAAVIATVKKGVYKAFTISQGPVIPTEETADQRKERRNTWLLQNSN